MKALVLACLTATACAGADTTIAAPETSQTTYETLPATEGPTELLEALDEASLAWADMGVEAPCQAYVHYMAPEDAEEACHLGVADGEQIVGCWVYWEAFSALLITRGVENDPDMLHEVMVHELGHSIKRRGGHLPCPATPGDSVMCPSGNDTGEITDRDVRFVTGAP